MLLSGTVWPKNLGLKGFLYMFKIAKCFGSSKVMICLIKMQYF